MTKSILAFFTLSVLTGTAYAENPLPIGKPMNTPSIEQPVATHEETPNQRRHRLGQPIVASFPAPDFGVKEETPNQRRKRLGQALPQVASPVDFGVKEETPNQRRAREALSAH